MAVEEIDAFWRTTGPHKRIFVIKYSRKTIRKYIFGQIFQRLKLIIRYLVAAVRRGPLEDHWAR